MYDARTRGQIDALEALGLVKVAGVGQVLKNTGGWMKKKLPTWRGFRRGAIGQPKRFVEEIASGRALAKGSLLRESFHTPTTMSKVMFYGFPAVESAGVMMDDEGDKAKRVGSALGGAALGMAAYSPLGMVGSLAADPLGRYIGGRMGQTAGYLGDKATGNLPKSNPEPDTEPNNELG